MKSKAAILFGVALSCLRVSGEVLFGPHLVASTPQVCGQEAAGLHVIGEHAFVAGGTNGLVVLNIADPARPRRVATRRMTNQAGTMTATAVDVTGWGNTVFVSAGEFGGLGVFDVADPANPILRGTYRFNNIQGAFATERYVYVAGGIGGVAVVDYSDPAQLRYVGGYDTPRNATSATIAEGRLYVTDSFSGLFIFDLANPERPALLGQYDTSGGCMDVAVKDGFAHIADTGAGMIVVDVSNPATPTLATTLFAARFASDVMIDGNLAFVTGLANLYAVDISAPTAPAIRAQYFLSGNLLGAMTRAGDRFYIADSNGGFSVFRENTEQVAQEIELFGPRFDAEFGFRALVAITSGTYQLQYRANMETAWVTRSTFGASMQGTRGVQAPAQGLGAHGVFRVVKQ